MQKYLKPLLLILLLSASLYADRKSDEEFWADEDSEPSSAQSNHAITDFPGSGFVYAGLMGYANVGGGDDDYTAGFRISASLKDYLRYISIRVDGFLGIGGPFEGFIEGDFTLVKGLIVGVGLSQTKRLHLSPRFGLYVEDVSNSSRRGGLYLLESGSGGIEVSWPYDKNWSFFGDFGMEKVNDTKYTKIMAGTFYSF